MPDEFYMSLLWTSDLRAGGGASHVYIKWETYFMLHPYLVSVYLALVQLTTTFHLL